MCLCNSCEEEVIFPSPSMANFCDKCGEALYNSYTVQDLIDALEALPAKMKSCKAVFLTPDFKQWEIAPMDPEEHIETPELVIALNKNGLFY